MLFVINLKDYKQKHANCQALLLHLYLNGFKFLKHFIPTYGELPELYNNAGEPSEIMPSMNGEDIDRSNYNKYIAGSIAYLLNLKHRDKGDANRYILTLFRLLTLKFRCKFPVRELKYRVDVDIKAYIDHKICTHLPK